ncbi:unnamed protein product [Brassicogethes aeneus]|uniref:Tetraspanin n=1 Tax=Brassicogethes aeneus TaxID=1431903 RepID=A0A9P0FH13_BRAAE|nr:unnamed protein product [Brassicogethes aeneus]
MGCCATALKIINGLMSVFYSIVALMMFILGAYALFIVFWAHDEKTIEQELLAVPAIVFLALGFLLILTVIIGCCGICREAPCCTETYSVFLIILGLAQLALGAYLLVEQNNQQRLVNRVDTDLQSLLNRYRDDPRPLDQIQEFMECCGKDSPADFSLMVHGQEWPTSCCPQGTKFCTDYRAFRTGCLDEIVNLSRFNNIILGWVSIIVGLSEIFGAVLGFWVSCGVWRKQTITWA